MENKLFELLEDSRKVRIVWNNPRIIPEGGYWHGKRYSYDPVSPKHQGIFSSHGWKLNWYYDIESFLTLSAAGEAKFHQYGDITQHSVLFWNKIRAWEAPATIVSIKD